MLTECKFTTERLIVESWDAALRESEARALLKVELSSLLVPAVTKFLPAPMQLTCGPDAIETWISAQASESDVFCVRDRGSQTLLGLLILTGSGGGDDTLELRLGYLLAVDSWGRGIATELIRGLVAWCQKQPGDTQLIGGVARENPASAAVLKKAGFELSEEQSAAGADVFRLNIRQEAE